MNEKYFDDLLPEKLPEVMVFDSDVLGSGGEVVTCYNCNASPVVLKGLERNFRTREVKLKDK